MRSYKRVLLTLIALATNYVAFSQEIKLFPEGFITDKALYSEHRAEIKPNMGGEGNIRWTGVGDPTITLYRAKSNSRTAKTVVVCPGGGYNILSLNTEGTEICEYLSHYGFNAVLLKYRVPRRPEREIYEAPLEDVQRAISYLRAKATELEIPGDKIGVIGFSAGGHLAVMCSTSERSYKKLDEVDDFSCRPDFSILLYPAYLKGDGFSLSPDVKVSANTPPTFISQSQNDKNCVDGALFYYYALKEAGVAATMHIYPDGGHGYGVRKTGATSDGWERRMVEWLNALEV